MGMTNKEVEDKKKNNQEEKSEDKNQEISQLEEIKKKRDEYLEGWKRARADFVNYKKNEAARLSKARKDEKKKIILDLLEIVDNFYLAEKNIPDNEKNDYLAGLLNIRKQMEKFLRDYGVEEIETVEKEFDPNIHEAVAMVDSEKFKNNTIIEEVNKGYLLDGELLRPAKVKVAK